MARYIDADLIENIELIPYKRESGNINAIIANVAIVGAKQVVDKIPTADVQPVIHAHWVKNPRWVEWSCTNCNAVQQRCTRYCGWCGAKMDEEVE